MGTTAVATERHDFYVRLANDAATHSRSATGWEHEFEQVSASPFSAVHTECWLGCIQVGYERIDGAYRYSGRPWKGARVFLAMLPGSGDVLYDGRPLGCETLVTHPWDISQRATCNRMSEAVFVAIDAAFFDRYAARHGAACYRHANSPAPMVCSKDPRAVAAFERRVMGSLQMMGENQALLTNPRVRRELQQSLLETLCEVLLGETPDDNRLPSSSTRAYVVEKASRFIEAHLADSLTVSDISTAVRVCPRTLRYSFEQVLGVTPSQYIRAQRLNRVRRDLLDRRSDSVQRAATRWGFWHMGRFANYYRKTFGESPSRTIHEQTRSRAESGDTAAAPPLPRSFYHAASHLLGNALPA